MPQAQITALLHRAIVDGLGEDAVRTEPDDLAYYGADRCRGSWPVAPSMIVLPRAVEQVQTVVRLCAEHGAAIVPSGGRTGLAGAATATNGEVVLSLERMHDVLEIDVAARTLRCEAGATIEAVQVAAAGAGLLYPVDFAAKGSAQVGGSIATNAGGVRVLRYGSTRSWVAGLRVVVASGDVLEIGGSLVKDNTGYDLRQMFIGSEGTLGIIVEATLKLTSPPRGSKVALCAVPEDGKVLELFARVQGAMVLRAFTSTDPARWQRPAFSTCCSKPKSKERAPRRMRTPRWRLPSASPMRRKPVRSPMLCSQAPPSKPATCGRCEKTPANRCTASVRTNPTLPCRSLGLPTF
jgi:FAD/FMN-containing dehydrogenase